MSILRALNELAAHQLTSISNNNKNAFNNASKRNEIINMSKLHADSVGILYDTNGVYAKKFFGIPTAGRWNYSTTGLYFGTPTIVVGLYDNKNINLTWCAKELSTGKLIYLPYWHSCPLIWQEHVIKSS